MISINQNIVDDFKKVLAYSQDIEEPEVTELFHTYKVQKSKIAHHLLHDQLILTTETKVSVNLSDDEKTSKLSAFIFYLRNHNYPMGLIRFICSIPVTDFYQNILPADYPLNDEMVLPKGSKIIKLFKYFFEPEEYKRLEQAQNKASMLIQQQKIEGYLALSIHPLDFLSLSENNCNWRSCHSLDGEYRTGNLSYMGDCSTVIAYLSDGTKEKLPHFPNDVPWYSKKWRVLLHFDNTLNFCFASRQYPFESFSLLDEVRRIFLIYFNDWKRDYITSVHTTNDADLDIFHNTYFVVEDNIRNLESIVEDAPNSTHYNDLLESSVYKRPFYCYTYGGVYYNPKMILGSSVKCIRCGKEEICGDEMLCQSCTNEVRGYYYEEEEEEE